MSVVSDGRSKDTVSARGVRLGAAWIAAIAWCAASGAGARAHDFPRSESMVTVRGPDVHARVSLDLIELGGVDTNGDGAVSYSELDEQIDRIYALVKQHFVITADVPLVRMSVERYAVVDDHVLQMDLALVFASDVSDLTIRSTFDEIMRPDHQHATRVLIAGVTGNATLNALMPQATFRAGGATRLDAIGRFVRLGMEQMLTGYDHLAILATLLVATSTLGMVVKVIASFTLAHGLAFGLATSGVVLPPARVAGSLTAVGIAWIAAENLSGVRAVDRFVTAFVVGLVNGMGFSTVLAARLVPRPLLALASLSYWVGIDIGQLVVVAAMVPLVAGGASTVWPSLRRAVSVGTALLAAYWFVQRTFLNP